VDPFIESGFGFDAGPEVEFEMNLIAGPGRFGKRMADPRIGLQGPQKLYFRPSSSISPFIMAVNLPPSIVKANALRNTLVETLLKRPSHGHVCHSGGYDERGPPVLTRF
jgi:hypothetical protein